MFYNFFVLVFLQVESGHEWHRLMHWQHFQQLDYLKWKFEDECSDEDECTDVDRCFDEDKCTDEDEWTDVDKEKDWWKAEDNFADDPESEALADLMIDNLKSLGETLGVPLESDRGDGQASGAFVGNRGRINQLTLLCKKVGRIHQDRKPKTRRFKKRQGEVSITLFSFIKNIKKSVS